MTASEQAARSHAKKRLAMVLAGGIAGVAVGLGAVYGIGRFQRNLGDETCRPAVELADRIAPLARGEVAAFAVAHQPLRLPDLVFRNAAGAERHLADWRDRMVLLNLWATWCVPCRKEMPALEALQAQLGGEKFEVVSINIDTRDPEKPRAWLREVGIKGLAYYADQSAKVFQDLKVAGRATGMPTTLLVDRNGCEIGTLAGPAEWASEDALRLVTAALGK